MTNFPLLSHVVTIMRVYSNYNTMLTWRTLFHDRFRCSAAAAFSVEEIIGSQGKYTRDRDLTREKKNHARLAANTREFPPDFGTKMRADYLVRAASEYSDPFL